VGKEVIMSTPLTDKHIVWLDIETTGLDPVDHDIIEFAGVREGPEDKLHLYIWPDRPENAAAEALEVNGFTSEEWERRGALSMGKALPQITRFLADSILAGQNVSFDEGFIKQTMKRYNNRDKIGYHKLDVATLAIVHLRPLGLKKIRLHHVCDVLGISNEGEHTAMADVKRARAVYRALLDPSDALKDMWAFRIAELQAEG
jgi:DNA polymerase III alpha subunit (gram-positive type)